MIKCILSEIEFTNESELSNLKIQFDEKDIEKLINDFIEELIGNSANTKLEIELSGIVLDFNKVVINDLELRQPTKNDLRKLFLRDHHLEYHGIGEMPTCPSAIISTISFPEDNTTYEPTIELVSFTKIIVRFLTLFKIGDIKCLNFKVETNSILKSNAYKMYSNVNNLLNHINSTLDLYFPIFLGDGFKQKKYVITLHLAHHLNEFINTIGNEIYNLSSKGNLHINIAYGHYLNALIQYDTIMEDFYIEKRITEAIMGLESIYSNERGELPYRVKIRISKVFDTLIKNEPKKYRELLVNNYNPINVKTRINEAYKIRNAFAHGDRPKKNTYNKIEKNLKGIDNEYKGLDELLIHLTDYLRSSIILLLFTGKDKFIELIDNSLINCKNEELDVVFSKTKNLFLLNNVNLTIEQTNSWIKSKKNYADVVD